MTNKHESWGTIAIQWHRPGLQQAHGTFHKLRIDTSIWTQWKHRTPNRKDQKRKSPQYITVNIPIIHNKECTLKIVREKLHTRYKGKPVEMAADFSMETLEVPWAMYISPKRLWQPASHNILTTTMCHDLRWKKLRKHFIILTA